VFYKAELFLSIVLRSLVTAATIVKVTEQRFINLLLSYSCGAGE